MENPKNNNGNPPANPNSPTETALVAGEFVLIQFDPLTKQLSINVSADLEPQGLKALQMLLAAASQIAAIKQPAAEPSRILRPAGIFGRG